LGFESPCPILACERPWDGHLEINKSIGSPLAKCGAPNKVMLFGREYIGDVGNKLG
jgi:hypothetical protein